MTKRAPSLTAIFIRTRTLGTADMSIETASQIILAVLAVISSIVLVYEFTRLVRRRGEQTTRRA